MNGTVQTSGTGTINFKDSVQFIVISQNKQDTSVYYVSTTLVSEYANNTKLINSNILLYPNPTNDYFIIQSDNIIKQVDVLNASGIKLLTLNNYNSGQKISTDYFKSGVYLIRITLADNSIVSKLLIVQGK